MPESEKAARLARKDKTIERPARKISMNGGEEATAEAAPAEGEPVPEEATESAPAQEEAAPEEEPQQKSED